MTGQILICAVIFKVKEEELYDEINQWSSNLENHQ